MTTISGRRTPPAHLLGSGLIPGSFETRATGIRGAYTDALAGLSGEETNLFKDYGFKGTIDSAGKTNYTVDPTAHFSNYQTWLRGLAENLAGARADSVSRGLGGRGLANARSNLARFAGNQDQADMLNKFTGAATGIFGKRTGALRQQNTDLNSLEGEALQWWEQYGPDDPGSGGPSTPARSNKQKMRQGGLFGPYGPA